MKDHRHIPEDRAPRYTHCRVCRRTLVRIDQDEYRAGYWRAVGKVAA